MHEKKRASDPALQTNNIVDVPVSRIKMLLGRLLVRLFLPSHSDSVVNFKKCAPNEKVRASSWLNQKKVKDLTRRSQNNG